MNVKKRVNYVAGSAIFVGNRAVLIPIDHPDVSNSGEVVTSPVVSYDNHPPIIETHNTIYIPVGEI